jgi:hypothetical protein
MLRRRLLASSFALTFACAAALAQQDPAPKPTPQPTVPAPAAQQAGSDEPTKTPSDFVRFVAVGDGGHLDTAITTYRKGDVTLTLFGAVHIADQACYATLNDRFTLCDALLYELVAEADTRPTKDRDEGMNPVALLQRGMKNVLELSFQLDEIDYQAANFVHADMTPAEFAASMDARGESMLSILLDMMLKGMEQQAEAAARAEVEGGAKPQASAFDLIKAFRSGEGRHSIRMLAATQLEQVEMMSAGGGGSTLLEGRNEKCLEVLAREVGKGKKKLGIYYGAAHLPHMEKRLVEDLGWQKVGHEWLVAWDCAKRPDPKFDRALVKARQRCRDELKALGAAAKVWRLANGRAKVPTAAELAAGKQQDGSPFYAGPVQDPWGSDYVVRKRAVGSRWEVVSAGQDKQLGSDDDLIVVEERAGGMNPR